MAATAQDLTYSEPKYSSAAANDFNHPWYISSIEGLLIPETQKLLQNYSGISPRDQLEHVHRIREMAWKRRAYPCVGMGTFLTPYISCSPAYEEVLACLKAGGTMLDVGCLMGSDLRRAAFDGAPTDRMYALDIASHWDIGFSLFRDQGRFDARFIEVDFLERGVPALDELHGKMDVISVSAVLHQWVWDAQVEAAKRLVEFSSGPGALIIGYQIGNLQGRQVQLAVIDTPVWRHDVGSIRRLWQQVSQETGTRWQTDARFPTKDELGWDLRGQRWMMDDDRVVDFVVTRLA